MNNAHRHRVYACLLALLLMVQPGLAAQRVAAAPQVVYVNKDARGDNDGTSWADAYNSLQDALNASSGATEIWIAAGTYRPAGAQGSRDSSFVMRNDLAIYGGFAGGETERSQRNWNTNVTILSGDLNGNDAGTSFMGDNSYHVMLAINAANVTIDGVTIRGGNANGQTTPQFLGGGLYATSSSQLTLSNVVFDTNRAHIMGGGMFSTSSNPRMTNVTFRGNFAAYGGGLSSTTETIRLTTTAFTSNSASVDGGAMHLHGNAYIINSNWNNNHAGGSGGALATDEGGVQLSAVSFTQNSAPVGGALTAKNNSELRLSNVSLSSNEATQYGGGMHLDSSIATLDQVTFITNAAGQAGGGMYNTKSSPTLDNVIFSQNKAIHSSTNSGYGGGMYNTNGSHPVLSDVRFTGNQANFGAGVANSNSNPTLTRVMFTSNQATSFGGGMVNDTSSPTLTNVTFRENTAGSHGGAIWNGACSPIIKDSTFITNQAVTHGGAIYNAVAHPIIINSVFQANLAGGSGGGIYNWANSSPTLRNSTLYGNTAESGGAIANVNSTPALQNVIVYDNRATNGASLFNSASTPTVQSSLIQGSGGSANWQTVFGTDLGANLDADPLFADINNADLRLRPSSPALNAGTSTNAPVTDLRGVSRPQGGALDMGAYEMLPFALTVVDGSNQSAQVTTAFAKQLVLSVTEGSNPLPNVAISWSVDAEEGSAGATLSSVSMRTGSQGQANTSAIANDRLGTYAVSARVRGIDTAATFTLTNVAQNQTISFDSIADHTYGDEPFRIGASASSGLAVSFSSATPTICRVESAIVTIIGAGTCTIDANQSGDSTYATAATVSQTFTIRRAVLKITANDATRLVGEPDPLFTARFDGFVYNDTMASLSDTLTITTNATASSASGTYPIIPSGVRSANYSMQYVNGTLTITDKPSPSAMSFRIMLPLVISNEAR